MLTTASLQLIHRHHGIISRRQALEAGMSAATLARHVASGELVAVHRGVYRHAVVPATWESDLMAACLRYGAVASHRSAARLWDLDTNRTSVPEITVSHGGWRNARPAILHQSTQLELVNCTSRRGVPCTPLARTLLDLGAVLDVADMREVVDQVLRGKRLQPRHLYTVLALHSERGRDGCGSFRMILNVPDLLKRIPLSKWSRMVADLLVACGLPRPEFEFLVEVDNGETRFYIDLAYPEARLAIELDSRGFHDNADSFESDRARLRKLVVAGWNVLPLTWSQFMADGRGFAREVEALLARSRSVHADS